MTAKIDLKVLGYKNPVKIEESIKNVRKVLNFQSNLTNIGMDDEEFKKATDIEKEQAGIANQLEMINLTVEYISDVLSLNNKKQDELTDLSFDDVMAISREISNKILRRDQESDEDDDSGKK